MRSNKKKDGYRKSRHSKKAKQKIGELRPEWKDDPMKAPGLVYWWKDGKVLLDKRKKKIP